MRDGRWRRGRECCVSKPDPRPSMVQMWESMTSPAGGVYHQTTSAHRAPADRLLRPTAPGSFWWAQASLVMAWGRRLSPAPRRRLWLGARKHPALPCRAAAAAASKPRDGLPLQLTALLTDRLNPTLPLHPLSPAYRPPLPPPPPRMPPMPPQNDPRSRTPLRGRTQSPWEPWNKNKTKHTPYFWWCEWIIYAVLVSVFTAPKYFVNKRPFGTLPVWEGVGETNTQWRTNLEIFLSCKFDQICKISGYLRLLLQTERALYNQSKQEGLCEEYRFTYYRFVCVFDIAFVKQCNDTIASYLSPAATKKKKKIPI